jgi:hypothetical protein
MRLNVSKLIMEFVIDAHRTLSGANVVARIIQNY